MATTAKIVREYKKLKFKVRYHNRCHICGRSRGFIRLFGICRLDFRKLANAGLLPGVKKASW
ncbi:MAG: type Z 30S ribosomal protein S14 [Candidatus Shapirobacteria bacterium]|nr:type Z 30S ribosomal protein S14 [Candidatus Shapirobacteria bacterium]